MENRSNVTVCSIGALTESNDAENDICCVFDCLYCLYCGKCAHYGHHQSQFTSESPGYYFLAHLSFIDACYSCVNNPKVIVDSLYVKKISPFNECMIQIFGEHLFAGADIILLTAMTYDHYVVICKPLHYTTSHELAGL